MTKFHRFLVTIPAHAGVTDVRELRTDIQEQVKHYIHHGAKVRVITEKEVIMPRPLVPLSIAPTEEPVLTAFKAERKKAR